jgi:hypothetical protein
MGNVLASGQGRLRGANSLAARYSWRYKISMSTELSANKSKRGRPAVDTEAVNVRLERAALSLIDDWRRVQPNLPTRPEAIRRLIHLGLEGAKQQATTL